MSHLFWYVFARKFLFNPHFDLEPDYIIRKGIWHRIQRYTVQTEILPLFHTQVDNAISALYSPPNCPFPFDDHHQNLIHPCRARPHSPRQTASGCDQPFCHNSDVRTNRWDMRLLRSISALLSYSDGEQHAKNTEKSANDRSLVHYVNHRTFTCTWDLGTWYKTAYYIKFLWKWADINLWVKAPSSLLLWSVCGDISWSDSELTSDSLSDPTYTISYGWTQTRARKVSHGWWVNYI